MTTSQRGRLLVATPEMGDPNFDRSVVFIVEHNADGALGVVLNQPTGIAVADALPRWASAVTSPAELFRGGPVGTDALLGLMVADPLDPPAGFVPAHGAIGTIDLEQAPDDSTYRARVFSGYSGWAAGQLDAELLADAWHPVDARPGDIVHREPDRLWFDVLGRQRGKLRLLANYPDDPRVN
ncbi:MAG: YqgE/AlgH family protein [Acidimicrobiales bacterium]|nr:YqgE/AlgH family protein [Acidimicrobiales bacterium]